ncbi:hypothetical protein BCON_0009g00370 [Botryotinia convoluta]|uniref:Uncharacterized protein n=1 Tax=Botryotinia convoluta TaxID=54673 RepID=A0A4Z1IRF6_9HELO|nr:hypothetical protein BCON_0009g00370 [Botryotinia convoluta]
MPIGQDDYNCPKKSTLDSSGHCSNAIPNVPGKQGCTGYCEIKLTAGYGQEVPIMDGSCQSGTTCSVSQGQSVTVTNGYSINIGTGLGTGKEISKMLTQGFNIGASYSWSQSIGYTTTETFSKTLDGKTCGYWTFIPYLMTSCGTLTTAPTGYTPSGFSNPWPYCSKSGYKDTGNWCNTTPYKDSNGHAEGKVLFVLTDCKTNGVLKTGQDPAYEYPGVSTGPN